MSVLKCYLSINKNLLFLTIFCVIFDKKTSPIIRTRFLNSFLINLYSRISGTQPFVETVLVPTVALPTPLVE